MFKRKPIAIFFSITSLFGGIFIYSFFRQPPQILNYIYNKLGIINIIHQTRIQFNAVELADWILYGLPDMLWMFSFLLIILTIWNFRLSKMSTPWIISSILIGLGFELLQYLSVIPGQFDFKDLGFILLGSLAALLFCIKK